MTAAPRAEISRLLHEQLSFLPDLIIREVPGGFSISSSAWTWTDGDRCGVYAIESADGWTIADSGDNLGWRVPDVPATALLLQRMGARLDDDLCIAVGPISPTGLGAAAIHLIGLLWLAAEIIDPGED